jgi:hypothetical protein
VRNLDGGSRVRLTLDTGRRSFVCRRQHFREFKDDARTACGGGFGCGVPVSESVISGLGDLDLRLDGRNTKNSLKFTSHCLALLAFLFATTVHAQPPPNDDFDSATIVVEPLPFNDNVDTSEATTAVDDPDCAGNVPTV